ncbi:MAG: hypothetical protein KIH62_000615 [Candidatus Kerfeldbacteria bacterium]|nr:hypothetical protein [Candidatus Kerfeldbacteria bacterium]
MDSYIAMAVRIIREQELIIGPLAWDEAKKVAGLNIDTKKEEITITGDKVGVLNGLVKQYSRLFGRASQEVCKDAVKDLIADLSGEQVPELLK